MAECDAEEAASGTGKEHAQCSVGHPEANGPLPGTKADVGDEERAREIAEQDLGTSRKQVKHRPRIITHHYPWKGKGGVPPPQILPSCRSD